MATTIHTNSTIAFKTITAYRSQLPTLIMATTVYPTVTTAHSNHWSWQPLLIVTADHGNDYCLSHGNHRSWQPLLVGNHASRERSERRTNLFFCLCQFHFEVGYVFIEIIVSLLEGHINFLKVSNFLVLVCYFLQQFFILGLLPALWLSLTMTGMQKDTR